MKTLSRTMPALCALASLSIVALAVGRTETPRVGCRVELDRAVLPAEGPQEAVIKVTLDAPRPEKQRNRPPVNLCLVLDRSGSMNGEKMQKAKEAAIEALHRLAAGDLFSLVLYNHTVETIVPAQSASNTAHIESRIRAITATGNTALFGGVSQGAAEIRKNLKEEYVHRIILLSDGLANVGPSAPEDLGRLGAGLMKEGISVSTIGVGTDYNEDLMARLAQKSDGNTYFVASSADLPRIFSSELGDVLSIMAKKVKIIIECPDGVEPIEIVGREGRISDNRVELYLNQLYGGQEKFALVQVRIPEGRAGVSREVAIARVTYEDAISQETLTSEGRAAARYSNEKQAIEASVNTTVEKAFFFNQAAEAQNAAIELSDKGDRPGAVQTLRKRASSLRSWGADNNDVDALRSAGELEEAAEDIELRGMSNERRKSMRAGSYQEINQQRGR